MIIICHMNHNLLDKLPHIISDNLSMFFYFLFFIYEYDSSMLVVFIRSYLISTYFYEKTGHTLVSLFFC